MGLTLLKAATGIKIRGLNASEERMEDCYKEIHKTELPTQIKSTILHMIAYNRKNRIPSLSLFKALYDIIK